MFCSVYEYAIPKSVYRFYGFVVHSTQLIKQPWRMELKLIYECSTPDWRHLRSLYMAACRPAFTVQWTLITVSITGWSLADFQVTWREFVNFCSKLGAGFVVKAQKQDRNECELHCKISFKIYVYKSLSLPEKPKYVASYLFHLFLAKP